MTVLVPGLHLLDAETYASAGLMAARKRLAVLDADDEWKPFVPPQRTPSP